MRKSNRILEQEFRACEGQSPVDEERTKAIASILNSKALGFIPVVVPVDRQWQQSLQTFPRKPFSESDYLKAEKLKLRALAMMDRLASNSDARRRAHRDLSLWYKELGKEELAEKQKQILFELVGTKNDSILYPQVGGCGRLIWWQKERVNSLMNIDCGMG